MWSSDGPPTDKELMDEDKRLRLFIQFIAAAPSLWWQSLNPDHRDREYSNSLATLNITEHHSTFLI